MAKANVDSQPRGFYYALSGNDRFAGSSLETPKRTIQAAIDATAALVPPPGPNASAFVTVAQGGSFFEGFVLPTFVTFAGAGAILQTDLPLAVDIGSSLRCTLEVLTNTHEDGILFNLDGSKSVGMFTLFTGCFGVNSIGFNITGNVGSVFCSTSQISMIGPGSTGFKITGTSLTPTDLSVNVAEMLADNTTFLNYDSPDDCVINVSSIISNGFVTTGFDVNAGRLVIETSGILEATTAIHVKSGAVAHLSSTTIKGDIVVDDGGILEIIALNHDAGVVINNGTINGNIGGRNYGTYLDDYNRILVGDSGNVVTSTSGNMLIASIP